MSGNPGGTLREAEGRAGGPALREEAGLPPPARRGEPSRGLSAWWLGQAGFLLEWDALRAAIDPYLSDSLAKKYLGAPYPHKRMMPSPIAPTGLLDLDLVLATHGHGDHLDPETLAPLAAANPRCLFVLPASCERLALERGVPADRLVLADAFAPLSIRGLRIRPIPSAHEGLAIDEGGHHRFLGYILERSGLRAYHPGDCCPYPGLLPELARAPIDLALLPVNGRDPVRAAAGIAGNFSLDEAAALAREAGFRACLGHHYGMFDFNTVDPEAAEARIAGLGRPSFRLARLDTRYSVDARLERG